MNGPFGDSVLALVGLLFSLLVTYNSFCLSETTSSNNDIDLETLSMFGVTPEFAEQFRLNLIKAIEAEEKEQSALRQGEFGGVSGGFFQGGNQGGGGGAGAGGGGTDGGDEGEDDEDDMPMMMVPGPGAFGVLSGLFGIFSGLGTLSPSRIIQSTVNFFPPGQRQMAQMIVDSLIGYVPPENRTLGPRPRPRVTTTPLPLNETMMMASGADELDANSTVIAAQGNETVVAKDAESVNGTLAGGMEETMPMAAEVMSAIATPRPKTTPGPMSVHKLLNETVEVPPPSVNEDDEEDVEKRYTTPRSKPVVSGAAGYKLKQKPSPAPEDVTAGASS